MPAVESRIRQEQLRRAAFDDRPQQVGRREVLDRLRGQDHRGVPLAPRLEALLHVGAQRRVLDEAPGLVHHAQLERRRLRRVLDARGDAVQHVEQQRLEERRIRAHRLEVEDLEALDRQRVVDVVEEAGVAAALDPLVQPGRQRARQQVRQREQPTLAAVEDVEVLDGLVELAVLEVAEAIVVVAFQQHADERMQEVQVLRRRLERERVDRDAVLPKAELEIAPAEQRRQLPVAVPEVEDDGQRRRTSARG